MSAANAARTVADDQELLASLAQSRHALRSGIDYYDGKLWYGLEANGKAFFLTSGPAAIQVEKLPATVNADDSVFPEAPLSQAGIERFLKGETVNGVEVIEGLEKFFQTHAKFQLDSTPTVLAHWALGGYVYMAFPTYPYLWITSISKQCGKSRVLELLSAVSFRSSGISIDPTPAVLYRSVDQIGPVLIIDEFENAADDSRRALLMVLNAGFRNGATVSRCVGQDQRIERFNAYCPKVFAGLSSLPDTLASRTIPIHMFPKAKKDNIQPFSAVQMEAQLQGLRNDMAIWALTNASKAAEAALKPSGLGLPDCLDDRAADYMAPLFAVANVAGTSVKGLVSFCEDLANLRGNDASDTVPPKLIRALRQWYPPEQPLARVHLDTVAPLLKEGGVYGDSKTIGRWARNLGLDVKQFRIGEVSKKGFEISKDTLDDLAERFGA